MSRFRRASAIKKEDVFAELKKELNTRDHDQRIEQLETILRPMYAALPKLPDGTLGHSVMRFALHRLLAKANGWFVIGLEPDRDGTNMTVSSIKMQMEWAPAYLQDVLESSHRGRGVSMHEVAVLATTLEELARREAVGRLEDIYDIYKMNKSEQPLSEDNLVLLLETFALVYLKGGNWTAQTNEEARKRLFIFKHNHKHTPRLKGWLHNLSEAALKDVGVRNFTLTSRIADDIGKQFGKYNLADCKGLKETLLAMEDRMPGRVLLSDFYHKGLYGSWKFIEKVDYLRDLGALDESDPGKPRVIVPNYVGSKSQCLFSSGVYAICCPNECEVLMEQLELAIDDPDASPQQVVGLVENMSSPTVVAPRKLSTSLLSRLDSVAAVNGGRIPLQGRLFAQWMHNVFPRECPFPHATGTISPLSPDEWMRNSGHTSTDASEEEMVCHVSGPCAGGASHASSSAEESSLQNGNDLDVMEIPWSDAEELLDGPSRPPLVSGFSHVYRASRSSPQEHNYFNNLLRTFAISGTAFGIAISFKLPLSQAGVGSKASKGRTWALRACFLIPLVILTVDLIFDVSHVNELFLCAMCWGLAALVYLTRPAFQTCVGDEGYWKEKYAV